MVVVTHLFLVTCENFYSWLFWLCHSHCGGLQERHDHLKPKASFPCRKVLLEQSDHNCGVIRDATGVDHIPVKGDEEEILIPIIDGTLTIEYLLHGKEALGLR